MPLSRCAAALALALPIFAANTLPPDGNLTVHEWGTFTSVAGPKGNAIEWLPLAGTPDLPCFVHHLNAPNPKYSMYSLVRMETPVLYFYAQRPMTLAVRVAFPQGLFTEWYPQATKVSPGTLNLVFQNGRIDWENVQVGTAGSGEFPVGKESSRYYAARATDAAPVRIGEEQEKLIFYRGAGNFEVPVQPKFIDGGKLEIRNTGSAPVAVAILFENRGGKMGYRVIRGLAHGVVTVETPALSGSAAAVRAELAGALQEMGLYAKEAQAMLATWGDSWFEEGMRVIYLAPRSMVDTELPLEVKPAPRQTARVFVGRVELLSPAMRETIETALAAGDVETLAKYGRFLDRFVDQIRARHGGRLNAAPAAAAFLEGHSAEAIKQFASFRCLP